MALVPTPPISARAFAKEIGLDPNCAFDILGSSALGPSASIDLMLKIVPEPSASLPGGVAAGLRICRHKIGRLAILAAALLHADVALALSVTLSANKDNTLYENATGAQSNGAGDSFFVGRTGVSDGSHIRRGTIAFDLGSAIPSNATVTGVTLTLFLAQGASSSFGESVSVFALTANWGEGTSLATSGNPSPATTGDATWLHRFYDTAFWSSPGGDFDPQASATITIGSSFQSYSWTGPGLVDDVQGWAVNPASNFGWILRGNEAMTNTALRFNSRQASVAANRPQLTILYTAVPEPSAAALLIGGLLLLRRTKLLPPDAALTPEARGRPIPAAE